MLSTQVLVSQYQISSFTKPFRSPLMFALNMVRIDKLLLKPPIQDDQFFAPPPKISKKVMRVHTILDYSVTVLSIINRPYIIPHLWLYYNAQYIFILFLPLPSFLGFDDNRDNVMYIYCHCCCLPFSSQKNNNMNMNNDTQHNDEAVKTM